MYPCETEVIVGVCVMKVNMEYLCVHMDWERMGDHDLSWIGYKDDERSRCYTYNAWYHDWHHLASKKIADYIKDIEDWLCFNTNMDKQRFEKIKVTQVGFCEACFLSTHWTIWKSV